MKFGETLKALLVANGLKTYHLAQYLGYDASYISKWISSTKHPSANNLEETVEKIALFFIEYGNISSLVGVLSRYTGSALSLASDTADNALIADTIKELLKTAYWENRSAEFSVISGKSESDTALQSTQLRNRLICEKFSQLSDKNVESLNCVLSDDIHIVLLNNSQNAHSFLSEKTSYSLVNMDILINPAVWLKRFTSTCKYILSQLTIRPGRCIQFYELCHDGILSTDEVCIVENQFVISKSTEPFSGHQVYICFENDAAISEYHQAAKSFINKQVKMIESVSPGTPNYRKNLYLYAMRDIHKYFLCQMFPIYLDTPMIDRFVDKLDSDNKVYASHYSREYMGKTSVIIYESAVIDYLQTGELRHGNQAKSVVFSHEERKQHLKGIIDRIEAGGHLELRILSDVNPCINRDEISVSLFLNEDIAYAFNSEPSEFVHFFTSKNCRGNFNRFFFQVQNLPENYLMSQERTLEFLKRGIDML